MCYNINVDMLIVSDLIKEDGKKIRKYHNKMRIVMGKFKQKMKGVQYHMIGIAKQNEF
jgi:hypothetical protein